MNSRSVTSDRFLFKKKTKPQRITNCKKKHLENSTLENSRCFCILNTYEQKII